MAENSKRVNFKSHQSLINQPSDNNNWSITSTEGQGHIFSNEESMYPTQNLFEEVVRQEDITWRKTQGIRIPVEGGCGMIPWVGMRVASLNDPLIETIAK